jgi:hypothetical protein
MGLVVTPSQVEAKLVALSKEVDEGHDELTAAEYRYGIAKAEYELSVARHRLTSRNTGIKQTVQERDDLATMGCENQLKELAIAEALVKAARANTARLRTQVDIARSIGTSVRTGLDA